MEVSDLRAAIASATEAVIAAEAKKSSAALRDSTVPLASQSPQASSLPPPLPGATTPGRKVRVKSAEAEDNSPCQADGASPRFSSTPRTPALTARTAEVADEESVGGDVSFISSAELAKAAAAKAMEALESADAEAKAKAVPEPTLQPQSQRARAPAMSPETMTINSEAGLTAVVGLARATQEVAEKAVRLGDMASSEEPAAYTSAASDVFGRQLVKDLLGKTGSRELEDSFFVASGTPAMSATARTAEAIEELDDGAASEGSFGLRATAQVLGEGLQEALVGMIPPADSTKPSPSTCSRILSGITSPVVQTEERLLETACASAVADAISAEENGYVRDKLHGISEESTMEEGQIVDMESVATVSNCGASQAPEVEQFQASRLDCTAKAPSPASRAGSASVKGSWAAGLNSGAATEVVVQHASDAIAEAVLDGIDNAVLEACMQRHPEDVPDGPFREELCRTDLSSMSTEARDNEPTLDTGALTSPASPPFLGSLATQMGQPTPGASSSGQKLLSPFTESRAAASQVKSEGSLMVSDGGTAISAGLASLLASPSKTAISGERAIPPASSGASRITSEGEAQLGFTFVDGKLSLGEEKPRTAGAASIR